MICIERGILGVTRPRRTRLNLLIAARSKEDGSKVPRLRFAYRDALLRLRRNEGPICRDL
jgi:hypothetical protein